MGLIQNAAPLHPHPLCTHRQTRYIINSLQLPILILLAVAASHNIITFSSTSLARNASHISGEETRKVDLVSQFVHTSRWKGDSLIKLIRQFHATIISATDLTYFRTFVCCGILNIYIFQQLIGIIILIYFYIIIYLLPRFVSFARILSFFLLNCAHFVTELRTVKFAHKYTRI